ncbi:MAG TPA: chromate resistance protein ChrB domain-containing protein [Nitrososphaerales archaeon]|nr:chromate resistance protein ChrB domain-containing protein [Nitrososphaerales archaeon]
MSKWITREKAHVDRIACPWLIKNFVDREAVFLYVPKDKVIEVAMQENATSYDTPGVELTHYQEDGFEHVSFDAIIKKYNLKENKALLKLAEIVRGADAKTPHNPPQESMGLRAAADGFALIAKDDFDNQRQQFPLYDALYRYCQSKIE